MFLCLAVPELSWQPWLPGGVQKQCKALFRRELPQVEKILGLPTHARTSVHGTQNSEA